MRADEERIALFLDYENLAIGARENLGGMFFEFKPVADALAERGRVIVRKAYADWLKFGEDGRMLTRHHVELIEIPQRMGSVRKNAADIKMAVDAIELCLERDYITTFVLGTGDSDFTPLVHKLREHDKQVIGLGVQMSTSALLPPACDEFLFYERLEGVEVPKRRAIVARGGRRGRRPQVGDVGEVEVEAPDADAPETTAPATIEEVEKLITQTLSGLERSGGAVRASSLKRGVLRKESTFSEADYGFRGFTELLRSLADRGVVELSDSSSPGDPDVQFPSSESPGEEGAAFDLLATVVERLANDGAGTPLSGLKTQLRRQQSEFSEKRFGYGGFLQFAKAAVTRGMVKMEWSDEADDYLLTPVAGRSSTAPSRDEASRLDAGEQPSAEARADSGAPAADTDANGNGNGRARRSRGGRGRGRAFQGGGGETASPTEDTADSTDQTTVAPAPDVEAIEAVEAVEAIETGEPSSETAAPAAIETPEPSPADDGEGRSSAVSTPDTPLGDAPPGDLSPAEPIPSTTVDVAEPSEPATLKPAKAKAAPKKRRATKAVAADAAERTADPVTEQPERAAPAKKAAPRRRATKATAPAAESTSDEGPTGGDAAG